MHIKDLCTKCDHWTITTIIHDGETATFTCTHCKNEFDLPWDTNTRYLIRSIRHSLKKRTKKYPELLNLKHEGQGIKIQEKASDPTA
ncbi:MAG: hypothetical protein ACJA2Y_001141 [Cycloclasticus pugetii]|jgi:hypothetical protein|uniref:Uncharacterized protein n=2 Tax=Cycloclasticus TaxID=34067 RepID=S5TZA9_9GAMM|nr:hypothetical protein [Cycloclasticus sp.]AFT66649.1 hypothetical protein Q91_0611 [Cycloclasticus sp. P1]AGS40303.1 hypothetical protein CYCME_1989 [Cycloclasticus zancles 78-ME]ATI03777.1 hypothetical protein CPC19_09980 [Cycloclasticus sp. PY97N]EPD14206.1 hypothetical protein L196_01875 [Cycloclasticus pugetii]PHR51878.1 MAG: hypothetical protein COA48_02055 [Cycloclasticus sp.]|tara:strand:+ start:742 stop:1002 length:261 start_codon:yes stop_codon:yes gene_type:complete